MTVSGGQREDEVPGVRRFASDAPLQVLDIHQPLRLQLADDGEQPGPVGLGGRRPVSEDFEEGDLMEAKLEPVEARAGQGSLAYGSGSPPERSAHGGRRRSAR